MRFVIPLTVQIERIFEHDDDEGIEKFVASFESAKQIFRLVFQRETQDSHVWNLATGGANFKTVVVRWQNTTRIRNNEIPISASFKCG